MIYNTTHTWQSVYTLSILQPKQLHTSFLYSDSVGTCRCMYIPPTKYCAYATIN